MNTSIKTFEDADEIVTSLAAAMSVPPITTLKTARKGPGLDGTMNTRTLSRHPPFPSITSKKGCDVYVTKRTVIYLVCYNKQ